MQNGKLFQNVKSKIVKRCKIRFQVFTMGFPYKILNDMSAKLKAAEAEIAKLKDGCRETQVNSVPSRGECHQTKPHVNRCEQTLPVSVQREPADSLSEVVRLKKMVADLIYENNRYHLALSYCHCFALDDAIIDTSESMEVSIRASTPLPCNLPSSDSAISSSTASGLVVSADNSKPPVVVDKKDEAFVDKMLKVLSKLETKYLTPTHKRKKRLFTRKSKISHIVPQEFLAIYHNVAAPDPESVPVPEPYPRVKWNLVKFKPVLPNPEPCPIYSCSPDPTFYVDRDSPSFQCNYNFDYLASQNGKPFGALPGFKTNLGVVRVPSTPVGGYVYCPDVKKWVIHATCPVGGGAREGLESFRRKKG